MLSLFFPVLARAAERRLSEFSPQGIANTACAFATVNYRDEKLFAALAVAAEWRLSDFTLVSIHMALWASSQHEHEVVLWKRSGRKIASSFICYGILRASSCQARIRKQNRFATKQQ